MAKLALPGFQSFSGWPLLSEPARLQPAEIDKRENTQETPQILYISHTVDAKELYQTLELDSNCYCLIGKSRLAEIFTFPLKCVRVHTHVCLYI